MDDRVDRRRLVSWLLDRARDEDETAEHRAREGDPLHVTDSYRDRARAFRDVARGVEAGEPDAFVAPDLSARKRQSGEHRVSLPEPGVDPGDVVTRPVIRRDPRREDD